MVWHKEGYEIPEKGKGRYLSDKQKRFIDEYLIDLNASAACLRAGYKTNHPEKVGAELLRHPKLRRYIDERMEAKREKNELSADYVIQKLISIVESTESGNPQAALRGLELLGKHLGLYKERQEISGPDGEAIQMEQKVKENADAFTRKLARLASSGGTGTVVKFPDGSGEGGA